MSWADSKSILWFHAPRVNSLSRCFSPKLSAQLRLSHAHQLYQHAIGLIFNRRLLFTHSPQFRFLNFSTTPCDYSYHTYTGCTCAQAHPDNAVENNSSLYHNSHNMLWPKIFIIATVSVRKCVTVPALIWIRHRFSRRHSSVNVRWTVVHP